MLQGPLRDALLQPGLAPEGRKPPLQLPGQGAGIQQARQRQGLGKIGILRRRGFPQGRPGIRHGGDMAGMFLRESHLPIGPFRAFKPQVVTLLGSEGGLLPLALAEQLVPEGVNPLGWRPGTDPPSNPDKLAARPLPPVPGPGAAPPAGSPPS